MTLDGVLSRREEAMKVLGYFYPWIMGRGMSQGKGGNGCDEQAEGDGGGAELARSKGSR